MENQRSFESEKVSILMPAYNSEYISQSIESVIQQSFQNWELLINDDASTDNTPNVLKRYASNDKRIRVFLQNTNQGPSVARNLLLRKAVGQYICFLDSDDKWDKDKLQIQIEEMKAREIAFSYMGYRIIDESNKVIGMFVPPTAISYEELLLINNIGCLTACIDRDVVSDFVFPSIAKRQDWGLWLSILRRYNLKAYRVGGAQASYRKGVGSVSANKLRLIKYNWKVLRQIEKLPFFRASWVMTRFIFLYLKKKRLTFKSGV